MLEPRALLATLVADAPQAYQTSTDQTAPTDQDQDHPLASEYATREAANADEETDPTYTGNPAPDLTALEQAIKIIEDSAWSKTEPGVTVLRNLKEAIKEKRITPSDILPDNVFADYNTTTGKYRYNPKYSKDPGALATALVHEGTHAVYAQTHPGEDDEDSPNYHEAYRFRTEYGAWQSERDFYNGLKESDRPQTGFYKEELDKLKNMTDEQLLVFLGDRYPLEPR